MNCQGRCYTRCIVYLHLQWMMHSLLHFSLMYLPRGFVTNTRCIVYSEKKWCALNTVWYILVRCTKFHCRTFNYDSMVFSRLSDMSLYIHWAAKGALQCTVMLYIAVILSTMHFTLYCSLVDGWMQSSCFKDVAKDGESRHHLDSSPVCSSELWSIAVKYLEELREPKHALW